MFAKTVDTELSRLETLLSRQEASVRQAFIEFVRGARSEAALRLAADALERGDIEGALKVVDSYITRLSSVLPQVYNQAATAELPAITQAMRSIVPVLAISFDPTDTMAAMQMRGATLRFVQQFTDAQRVATRQALGASLETGAGTQAQVRAFRDAIGLTANQEAAVRNYRRLLQAGSTEALSRELRDRRYDRSVARAARTGEPLSPQQVDTMVERYRSKYLAYRGETIARTETVEAVAMAREEALRQNLAAAGIPDRAVTQTWNTTMDGRERASHGAMNGQERTLGQPFQSPSGAVLRWPGDSLAPAAERVQCRCHRTFQIHAASGAVAA